MKKFMFLALASTLLQFSYANQNTLQITEPKIYTQNIPQGGNLTSSSNLYFSNNIESAPLYFKVDGITSITTVNFTIYDTKTNINGHNPRLLQTECLFNVNKPQPCTITIDLSNSIDGEYYIVPNINGAELNPIVINIVDGYNLALPDGDYTGYYPLITINNHSCKIEETETNPITIKNGQFCIYGISKYPVCTANKNIPIPNGPNSYINPETNDMYDGYAYNASWYNNQLTINWALETCPGFYIPLILTKNN